MSFLEWFWSIWCMAALLTAFATIPKVKTSRDVMEEKYPEIWWYTGGF